MVIVNHIFTFSFLSEGGSPTRLQSVKWSRGLIDHTRRSCKEIHFTVTNAWQISASWTPSHDLSWKKGQHCTVTQEQKHTSRVASLSWWQEIARGGSKENFLSFLFRLRFLVFYPYVLSQRLFRGCHTVTLVKCTWVQQQQAHWNFKVRTSVF